MKKRALEFILVAGGLGFIGTNLCERLMKEGNNIIVIDDQSSGTIENFHHLEDVSKQCKVWFIYKYCSITYNKLEDELIHYHISAIYNLACPASPPFYQKNPFHTAQTCFDGTLNLIRLAQAYNCPMLLTSTSEVYGDPTISPQSEGYKGNVNCYGPRACYDEGKRIAETLMYEANKLNPGKFKVVRIFNTYGPHMRPDDGRFISNFICQALNNEPFTIYGDGSQTRSICYVDDTVDGLIKMMNSDATGPINIGNPTEMTVNLWAEFIHSIIDCCGETPTELKIEYKDLPKDDPMQRCPDITKAQYVLGWEPKITPLEGLTNTIEYFYIQKQKDIHESKNV